MRTTKVDPPSAADWHDFKRDIRTEFKKLADENQRLRDLVNSNAGVYDNNFTALADYVNQLNERIVALEAAAPKSLRLQNVVDAMNAPMRPGDELTDDDVAELLAQNKRESAPKLQQAGEVKSMKNVDGSESIRLQMMAKQWLVIKLNPKREVIDCFVESEDDGEREQVPPDKYVDVLGGLVHLLRLAPLGEEPDPDWDRANNDDQ